MTICEININGKPHRFRITYWSNVSRYGTPDEDKFDVELTDISEDPTDKFKGQIIDHFKWKNAIRNGKVKII